MLLIKGHHSYSHRECYYVSVFVPCRTPFKYKGQSLTTHFLLRNSWNDTLIMTEIHKNVHKNSVMVPSLSVGFAYWLAEIQLRYYERQRCVKWDILLRYHGNQRQMLLWIDLKWSCAEDSFKSDRERKPVRLKQLKVSVELKRTGEPVSISSDECRSTAVLRSGTLCHRSSPSHRWLDIIKKWLNSWSVASVSLQPVAVL